MPPIACFLTGFIVGGLVMGTLTPLLFLWRDDAQAPSVRAEMDDMPTSEGDSSGVGGSE